MAIHQYVPGRHRQTGYDYSEVVSSGWANDKRYRTNKNKTLLQKHPICRTQNTEYYRNICIGSINTTTMKDPMKLAQCLSQCNVLKHQITFMQETHITGHNTTIFDDVELNW